MLNKKQWIILAAIVAIAVLILVVIFYDRGDNRDGPLGDGGSDDSAEFPLEWADAPNPASDMEKMDEYRRLWPDIDAPRADREQVKREFEEFAQRYPNNIYIPSQYLPDRTPEEVAEIRETIDSVASVESRLADMRAAARSAQPGRDGPDAPAQPSVSPEEQRRYFGFKQRELESRIQLIEYALEKNRLPADQLAEARKDLELWRKQLSEIQKVSGEVP